MTSIDDRSNRIRTLDTNIDGYDEVERVLKGIASTPRLQILEILWGENLSIGELAEALDMPPTTVAMHINILEETGFVRTELVPANRGRQKVCSLTPKRQLIISLPRKDLEPSKTYTVSMPVGAYTDCAVLPTCGLVSELGTIGAYDDVSMFYHPQRFLAQLLWFKQGYVEYRFPNAQHPKSRPTSIQFSLEVCSEAPNHADNWLSDITMWINGVEIGSWTSPADFGGERGVYTPDWWGEQNTQFGLLKTWRTTIKGSFIDGIPVSDVTIRELNLAQNSYISMRIGIKPDAMYIGGINIFGQKFGNYPQDIVMQVIYERENLGSQ